MDELEDVVYENEADIRMMYRRFAEHRPVMLFDIQEQRIYAYPYAQFSEELSLASQQALLQQYGQALQENQMVVFVRDNEERRLVSFSWPL